MSRPRVLLLMVGLALTGLVLTGCDLEGISTDYLKAVLDAGDNTPDNVDAGGDSGDGGGDDGGDTPTVIARFSGTWLASYGDDVATGVTSLGINEYAVRMTLVQNNTTISGSGEMVRMFREGTAATDTVNISVTGTASGDDATISITASPASKFDFTPVWYLRLSGNRMVGMYFASDVNDNVARSGYAIWHRAGTVDIGGSWIAGFSDVFPRTGTTKKDRTVSVNLARSADDTLTGNGSMVLQREGDVPDFKDFDVTRGLVSGSGVEFTFGALDLAGNLMDHFGFTTEGITATAYGQFDATDQLEQNGHATFYNAPAATPSSFNKV
ncbi:MAG: hypothetical protein GY851_23840, partial [bacterium]|nr:hypothetical protein [bacterium]